MTALGKILEPGERVLLRYPSVRSTVVLAVLAAGWEAALPVADMLQDINIALESGRTIAAHVIVGAFLLLVVFFLGRWRVVVTDRRVLVRRRLPGGPVEVIPRDGVEAARCVGTTLFIQGEGRILSTFCFPFFAKPLLKLIDPIYDNIKLRTPGLRKRLLAGEWVVLRERRSIPSILAWTAMPAMPLLVMLLFMTNIELVNDFLHIFSGIAILVVALALMLLLQLSFDISYFGLFFDHWRVAVTDRRVLVRRGLFGTRHDEILRADIESARYDPAARRLFLSDGGRELAIRCDQAGADRILNALGREPEEANSPPDASLAE